MKKLLFLLTLCALCTLCTQAQVLNPKKLPKARQAVWEEYVARLQSQPALLPQSLPALREGQHASFTLPKELESNEAGEAVTMNYYYGYKGTAPSEAAKSPLFLYLHGSGPRELEWSTGLHLGNMFADSPSVYIIPQIPQEGSWYRWYQRSKQWAWERILREALARPDIDPARLYLFGISEGGYGSQRLASFYADYLAAAGPMAGGEPLKNAPAENLRNIMFSLRTGAKDTGFYRNRLTRYTADALDSLQQLNPDGYRHLVELIPGYGHSIDYRPTPVYLSHAKRTPLPKQFTWEDFEMDGVHRTGFYYLYVDQRPNDSLRTRYDVNLKYTPDGAAEIHVSVENVYYRTTETDPYYGIELRFARSYEPAKGGRFTLFLDESLINLGKNVYLYVNGKQMHAGRVRLTKQTLQRSAEIWGDPLRLMPASITVAY